MQRVYQHTTILVCLLTIFTVRRRMRHHKALAIMFFFFFLFHPFILNLDRLLVRMWDEMSLLDRGGCTVEDFCNHIHRSLVKDVKYVMVWGHYPPFILCFCCLTDTSTLEKKAPLKT
ncbi:hypothetical protein PHAVU_010G133100 [Phaseolus vulgaris]|uniref:TGS domain-containing protein n=1 Tax=Phaseolus vulgaris TaxID=3885 RepID=V7ATD8_PHAVU|nr:hypothetical protein PHAVU_010G133100g [Phaseolus vulgaris]ESW07476.1 hypothetical protein PHAVU_010G133100g [Phaseolus vulgaris]